MMIAIGGISLLLLGTLVFFFFIRNRDQTEECNVEKKEQTQEYVNPLKEIIMPSGEEYTDKHLIFQIIINCEQVNKGILSLEDGNSETSLLGEVKHLLNAANTEDKVFDYSKHESKYPKLEGYFERCNSGIKGLVKILNNSSPKNNKRYFPVSPKGYAFNDKTTILDFETEMEQLNRYVSNLDPN